MAQTVFRPNQIINKSGEVLLKLSKEFAPPVEEVVEEEPEYTGPTADDLRREAEAFKKQWEQEKNQMIAQAQAQADKIIKDAENVAFNEVKKQSDQAAVIKNTAELNASDVVSKAKAEAEDIIRHAHDEEQHIFDMAQKDGFSKGHDEGYKVGSAESDRLVERLHKIIDSVQDKRQEILDGTEQQIVDLVLLMTRKIVKVISENQRNVVMSNIVHALRKVKGRGDVLIRVNMAELALTSEHTKEFLQAVENVKNITIVEDSAVDKGGCIIETDFGSIDARISSQLGELEQKILEISPVKSSVKPANPTES